MCNHCRHHDIEGHPSRTPDTPAQNTPDTQHEPHDEHRQTADGATDSLSRQETINAFVDLLRKAGEEIYVPKKPSRPPKPGTSLAERYPEVITRWCYELNNGITPEDVPSGSAAKYWWFDEACGHAWTRDAATAARTSTCPYCNNKKLLVGVNDLATQFPKIAAEWDYENNHGLAPQDVLPGTSRKVAWICSRGHQWSAKVYHRTRTRTGCPYCTGLYPIKGETDLATRFPEIAAEWHESLNGSLTPGDVTAFANRKVWWRGKECGHEWETSVANRTSGGRGCPYCAGQKVLPSFNSLAAKFPEIAAEWHESLNGSLTPGDVLAFTGRKVWWRGAQCGHEWEAAVASRTRIGSGCPYCAGKRPIVGESDLSSRFPQIAAEWHPTKNGDLTPEDVVAKSGRKVWWLGECGHEWEAAVVSRTNLGSGCPYCARRRPVVGETDLASRFPEIAAEWHPTKNGDLSPEDFLPSSGKKVWWLGRECGHEWESVIGSRTRIGVGCPICRESHGERDVRHWGADSGFIVQSQRKFADCRDINPLPFDNQFFLTVSTGPRGCLFPVALIETDGRQHTQAIPFFGGEEGLALRQRHDAIKDSYCQEKGIVLIRVPHTITGPDAIGDYLKEQLEDAGLGWAIECANEQVAVGAVA